MQDQPLGELRAQIARLADEVLHEHQLAVCRCHSLLADCCPNRVGGILAAGASRLGMHASGAGTGDVAALIDHTLLKPDASRADIERLCHEAIEFGFAAACINPTWARLASRLLAGSSVAVCCVVGFPLGATTADTKAFEARRALFDGARELDMVMNIGALKSSDLMVVLKDIEAVTTPAREAGAVTKVIIEAALLTDQEKIAACTLAKTAGADYVKTSTGFGPGGATADDVALMRSVVGKEMGVKAAGGIGSFEALRSMVTAGASRIGASAGVRIVREAHRGTTQPLTTTSY